MAKQNTGLGKGLEAIFLDNTPSEQGGVSMLRLSEIEPNPDQPRKEFDEDALYELADSIKQHGLIQPIVVRSAKIDGYYQIIAGERRWRACKIAGLNEVPVVIMETDDAKAAQIALIENIQRQDLSPIEEAKAYKKLLEDYGMTQEQLAGQIGKSRSAVANAMRLLDLPEAVLDLLASGELSAGHCRAILGIKDRSKMILAANTARINGLSVRDTEKLARKLNREKPSQPKENPDTKIDYTAILAQKMTSKLGEKVEIKKAGQTGTLAIHFNSDDELDELVTKLCGTGIMD